MATSVRWIEFTPDEGLAADMPAPDDVSFEQDFQHRRLAGGEGGVTLATLADRAAFSAHNHLFVNEHVIKDAGTLVHRYPAAYAQFDEIIRLVAAFEAAHSAMLVHKRCLLTIRQSELAKGAHQVGLQSWHTDRNDLFRSRPVVDHVYVACDRSPTMIQRRRLSDAFNELQQKPEEAVQAAPYDVCLLTNYTWHKTMPVTESGVRTFVRISYEGPDEDYIRQNMSPAERAALRL